jgi:hypothetical protein
MLGMPAHQLDLQAFVQFVLECTLDSRVTAEAVRATFPRDGGTGRPAERPRFHAYRGPGRNERAAA